MSKTVDRRSFLKFATLCVTGLTLPKFEVAAAADNEPLSFMVIGDWGKRGSDGQRRIAESMTAQARQTPPKLIISTGDNFYPAGVSDVTDPNWRRSFENVYTDPALQCPWFAVLGNHDYRGAVDAQIAYSDRGGRWRLPQRYYQHHERLIDGATAEFFFLDTPPLISHKPKLWLRWIDHDDPDRQLAWLESALRRSQARWKFVVGHHPIVSVGPHGTDKLFVGRLQPLFERYGVHAYFNGHEHNLQHHRRGGVDYFVCGAGASIAHGMSDCGAGFCARQLGFLSATVMGPSARFSYIGSDGRALYRTEIKAY